MNRTQQANVVEVAVGELIYIATPHGVVSVYANADHTTVYSPKEGGHFVLHGDGQPDYSQHEVFVKWIHEHWTAVGRGVGEKNERALAVFNAWKEYTNPEDAGQRQRIGRAIEAYQLDALGHGSEEWAE